MLSTMKNMNLLPKFRSLRRFYGEKVMITGGGGQVGQILYPSLCDKYGTENVLVTDIKETNLFNKFEKLDC